MGVANSNCIRHSDDDPDKSINGVQNKDARPTASPEATTNKPMMQDKGDCSQVADTAVPPSKATDDEPGQRRHSTPSFGTTHLLRLVIDSPDDEDVRCRRSGSAAPRRVSRPMKDESRRIALPQWAKTVRSSRGDSVTSLPCRGSGGGATAELGHNDDSTTEDARSAVVPDVRRREFLQTNYSIDEQPTGLVDSTDSGGRSLGIRRESQMSSDRGSSPPRDHVHSPQRPTAAQARPLQQRRSSIAFLPMSEASAGISQFSSKSMGPHVATKDRINIGFGNASDFVASLIGSKCPDPAASATEDNFWVPPTIWWKKRAQSLVPQKPSTDTRVVPGTSSHYSLYNEIHSISYVLAHVIENKY